VGWARPDHDHIPSCMEETALFTTSSWGKRRKKKRRRMRTRTTLARRPWQRLRPRLTLSAAAAVPVVVVRMGIRCHHPHDVRVCGPLERRFTRLPATTRKRRCTVATAAVGRGQQERLALSIELVFRCGFTPVSCLMSNASVSCLCLCLSLCSVCVCVRWRGGGGHFCTHACGSSC
jgi:hypothetical protein